MNASERGAVRTALVTGAARGIGRGVAVGLAERGHDVAVHFRGSEKDARETARRVEALGRRAILVQGDLTNPDAAEEVVEEAHAALGSLGVLVNVVGNYVKKPWWETTPEEWRDMLDSNFTATFATCRAAAPIMRAQGFGRIVNFGMAGAGNLLARPGIVPYVAAKSGVIVLTKAIAKTEAPHGVTANVVAPGVIETSVSQPVTDIPAGRLGTVEEVVGAVLFFVDASPYVTGQVLEVGGGWNL